MSYQITVIALFLTVFSSSGYVADIHSVPLKTQASLTKIVPQKGPFKIAYMPPSREFNYYLDIGRGINNEAKKTNNIVVTVAPQSDIPDIQLKMMMEVIKSDYNAIILSTHAPEKASSLIKEAIERGILVVIVNSDNLIYSTPVHAVVGYRQRNATKELGEYILKKHASRHLKIGIIKGAPGYHSQERVSGFYDVMIRNAIAVESIREGDWTTKGGYAAAMNMFNLHPNINLVFSANDFEALGVKSAIEALNLNDVFVYGNDGVPSALEQIYLGNMSGTVFTYPTKMGEIVMDVVIKSLHGQFEGGFVETPTIIIDKGNVEEVWVKPMVNSDSNLKKIIAVSAEIPRLSEADGKGLYWDILREVYSPFGVKFSHLLVPMKRAKRMVKQNQADLMLGSLRGDVDGVRYPQWHYSSDIVSVVFNNDKFPTWQGQETLRNKNVHWIRGQDYHHYLYVPVNKFETTDSTQGIGKLIKNRADFYIDSAFNINNLLQSKKRDLDALPGTNSGFRVEEVIRLKQYIAFANTQKGVELMWIFDEQFPKLLKSGKIRELFEKWEVTPFPFEQMDNFE
ncbi:MAG: substrate-binding domain-containing protein [Aestuariibacter sp.]